MNIREKSADIEILIEKDRSDNDESIELHEFEEEKEG